MKSLLIACSLYLSLLLLHSCEEAEPVGIDFSGLYAGEGKRITTTHKTYPNGEKRTDIEEFIYDVSLPVDMISEEANSMLIQWNNGTGSIPVYSGFELNNEITLIEGCNCISKSTESSAHNDYTDHTFRASFYEEENSLVLTISEESGINRDGFDIDSTGNLTTPHTYTYSMTYQATLYR